MANNLANALLHDKEIPITYLGSEDVDSKDPPEVACHLSLIYTSKYLHFHSVQHVTKFIQMNVNRVDR